MALNADVCLVNTALAVKETRLLVCVGVNSSCTVLLAEKYLQFVFRSKETLLCLDVEMMTHWKYC